MVTNYCRIQSEKCWKWQKCQKWLKVLNWTIALHQFFFQSYLMSFLFSSINCSIHLTVNFFFLASHLRYLGLCLMGGLNTNLAPTRQNQFLLSQNFSSVRGSHLNVWVTKMIHLYISLNFVMHCFRPLKVFNFIRLVKIPFEFQWVKRPSF